VTTDTDGAGAEGADDAFDAIASELYALPPAQFTAARARAAAAEPSLATRVKALRRPTVAAWAVDLLASRGELGEAIELSHALREAQDDLDATELARLGGQRRALVAALARQAVGLATDQGVAVSPAAREDIEKTLNAAVRDAGAAAAVLSGRLVRALEATGVDAVDLTGALAGSAPTAPAPRRDDLAERRARRAAEAAARDAEREASEVRRELARVDALLSRARDRADHLRERAGELRAELETVESPGADADRALDDLERQRAEVAGRAAASDRAASAARRALGDAAPADADRSD
jgi:hypothetical protein